MCKYCEMPEKLDRYNSHVYGEPNGAFTIYREGYNGTYFLGCEFELDIDDNIYPWENVIIKYCPFCGRKLSEE